MEPFKLHPKNIAGCNGVRVDDETAVGLFRLDLANGSHIVLEFPNPLGVDLAIERLRELRERWNTVSGKTTSPQASVRI